MTVRALRVIATHASLKGGMWSDLAAILTDAADQLEREERERKPPLEGVDHPIVYDPKGRKPEVAPAHSSER